MGEHSKDFVINEHQKPFAKSVSHDQYEIALGLRCSLCLKPFKKGKRGHIGDCHCQIR
jgi:hypothetical protein